MKRSGRVGPTLSRLRERKEKPGRLRRPGESDKSKNTPPSDTIGIRSSSPRCLFKRLSYAIPNKDYHLRTLPLWEIKEYVRLFIVDARICLPNLTLRVTPIGCGLAGYKPEQIAPLFKGVRSIVILPDEFTDALAYLAKRSMDRIAAGDE